MKPFTLLICIVAATSLHAAPQNDPLGINKSTKELNEPAVKAGSGTTVTFKSGSTLSLLSGSTLTAASGSTINLGTLTIDGGAAPSLSTFGQFSSDNDFFAASKGALLWYDGTGVRVVPAYNNATPPTSGQALVWDNTNKWWKPGTVSGGMGGGDLVSTNNLSDLTDFAAARSNLGLVISTNVQAYNANLTTLAGYTPGNILRYGVSQTFGTTSTVWDFVNGATITIKDSGTGHAALQIIDGGKLTLGTNGALEISSALPITEDGSALTAHSIWATGAAGLFAPISPGTSGWALISGGAGANAAFRALTSTDVGLGNVANVDTTNATNITSGTLPAAQLPALTGDATTTAGTVATTVGKINGTSLAGLATGILKNTTTTGVPSIAVAGDFPTLNQNTSGSAATLATTRAIYGNNFNGSSDLTQIIASTYGGTGNGFTKFSGPTSSEKTKSVRDANDTILELGGSYSPTGTWTSMNLTTPTIAGLTASGSSAITFAGNSGTFDSTTGANSLNGAVTVNAASIPSISLAAGKTNTGYLQINGKTNGALKITTADATAQTVTLILDAQTVGGPTLHIADQAGVSSNFVLTGDTGTVTSAMIANGTIVNADINASAAIAASKLVGTDIATVGTLTAGTASTGFTIQLGNVTFSGTMSGSNVSGGTFGAVNGSALTSLNGSNISSGTVPTARLSSDEQVRTIGFTTDGAGAVLTAGTKGYLVMPFAGTITGWKMICSPSGSVAVDIYKSAYSASTLPSTSIVASAAPTITSAIANKSTTLTGWTTSVSADDLLGFAITGSPATATKVTVELTITPN